MNQREICNCGEKAVWIYIPASTGNPYYCDSCVSRGCSCNNTYFENVDTIFINKGGSYILEDAIERKQKFRILDRKINGEESSYLSHKYVVDLDEQGRELPCCEFMKI